MNQKYALVTGASSGIGVEFARQLAQKGYSLVLVARRIERLEELKAEIIGKHSVDVVVISQDLSEKNAAHQLHQATTSQSIFPEILINNAAYGIQGKFLEMDLGKIDNMFALNMSTLTAMTQLYAKDMLAKSGGRIMNVASAAAFLPSPYVASYGASKAYVGAFTEALRYETKGSKLSVTAFYPGITTTEFNAVADAKTPKAMDISILSAEAVAKIGLKAMFRGKRAKVPGLINQFNAFLSTRLPRGWITSMAGGMLKKANGWH